MMRVCRRSNLFKPRLEYYERIVKADRDNRPTHWAHTSTPLLSCRVHDKMEVIVEASAFHDTAELLQSVLNVDVSMRGRKDTCDRDEAVACVAIESGRLSMPSFAGRRS